MSAFGDIARWFYKNPGVWSIQDVAQATGYSRTTVGSSLLALHAQEPKICRRLQQGIYMSVPPEASAETPAPAALPVPAEPEEPLLRFDEIVPDDEDLYPPVKIQIYDHWRGKRGEQWFRVKDEHGKRGVFRYIDDD